MPDSAPRNPYHLTGFIKYNLWGILWGLLIILLTMLPGSAFPTLPTFKDLFQPDKLVHLFIFGVYFYLQARGFLLQERFLLLKKHAILITFLIGLTLGGATEIAQQYLIPMRDGNIYDFTADAVGGGLGWLGLRLFFRR